MCFNVLGFSKNQHFLECKFIFARNLPECISGQVKDTFFYIFIYLLYIFYAGFVEKTRKFARKFPRNFPINLAYPAVCN